MPMGFCAILGGTVTMVGSSPLILLNDLILAANQTLAQENRMDPFGLFSVTPIGVSLIATGIFYFMIFFHKVAEEIGQALNRQDKQQARQLLSYWVYRDTSELSEVGLCKTVIEKLLTTSIYGTVATILFFAIGGAPLVLGARMIKQLEYTWPALNPKYREFGRPAYLLSTLIYWLPTQAWNFTLAIQGGPGALMQLLRPTKSPLPVNHYLPTCALAAKVLNTELGGPQKFTGQKVALMRIGTGPKPTPHTINAALKLAKFSKGIWILSLLLLPCLWAILRLLAHA